MKTIDEKDEYKVDSTRGSSLINPISYKGDVLVQVWVDSRVLATLTRWLEREGTYPRFMSEVVRIPLEMMAKYAVDVDGADMVEDTGEARTLLERRFHINLNRGGRGGKNILHNQVLSERIKEGMGKRGDNQIGEVESIVRLSQEEVRSKFRRAEILRKALEANERMDREDLKKQVDDAKNGGFLVIAEEPKVSKPGEGFREGMNDEELASYNRKREEEVRGRENAPIDIEFLKSRVVKI